MGRKSFPRLYSRSWVSASTVEAELLVSVVVVVVVVIRSNGVAIAIVVS